ncbi:hypothetical protein HPB47_008532, partial [Ixodes persulcatus]
MQRLSVYVDSKLLRRPGREKLLHSVKNAKRTRTGNHELDHHADTISRDHWLNAGYLADHWRSRPCLRHLRRPGWTLLETGQSDPAENDDHRS